MTRAYHFLRDDMTAGHGDEKPWAIGEKRTIKGDISLCERGYHSAPSWYDALNYAPGNMACIVEISKPVAKDDTKYVSKTRTLIAAANVETELRLWGIECAERALFRERERGREPDKRSWDAIDMAKRYTRGEATRQELDAAGAAARDAAWDAARAAAWDAAGDAARDAAGDAAWAAAWAAARAAARDAARAAARDAEISWQRNRLNEILDAKLAVSA